MTDEEIVKKTFDQYLDVLKSRGLKWTIPRDSRWGDRRINRYLKYFSLPIRMDEVLGLLDTTVLRTGKEGYLFTTSGIVVKEVINKLYYLKFSLIDRAEVLEERDEYYNFKTSVWVYFKDGTKRQVFDFYINKYFYVEYINAVVQKKVVSYGED